MSNTQKLRHTIGKRLDRMQKKQDPEPARIGLDDGTVFKGSNTKSCYVTYMDGTNELVLNHRLPCSWGTMVLVGYDPAIYPNRKQILSAWDIYPEVQWPGLVPHATDHGWEGRDTTWISGEQFLPALVIPVAGETKVYVYPITLLSETSWKLLTVSTLVDVSSNVPSSGFRFGLLVLDSTGTFVVRNGTIVSSRSLLTDTLIPLPEAGDNVLCALVLYSGMTELKKTSKFKDILDLRFSNTISIQKPKTSLLTVRETDSDPSVSEVKIINVPNGSLTNEGSGEVTLTWTGGGGSLASEVIDVSDQIVAGGETHFTYSPASTNIIVLVNGAAQRPADVTLDGDGLGFTFVSGMELGWNLLVVRMQEITTVTPGHTIQDNGTSKTQRTKLNFIGATVTDDSVNNATKIEISGGGHTIQNNGTPMTARANLNFVGATLTDNSGADSTVVTIASSGGDVVGPSSAVDSNFTSFDTTTGKLVKDSGSKASDFATSGHTHTYVQHVQVVFTIESNVNVTGTKPIRIHVPYVGAGATIEEVYIAVGTAPTTSALRIDVNKNATSIFNSTQYVEIAIGAYSASKTSDFASTSLAKDDYFTIEVVQGDTVASDLSVHIRYKWTLTGV